MLRQTTEITGPLKVFDSFSVFVEPISYQRNTTLTQTLVWLLLLDQNQG